MTSQIVVLLVAGLLALFAGGELLIRGATRLAAAAGIPPLIVGLTVVAFGTSAPELAVTLQAALNGQTDLVIGNVVGSNIANILLILGVAALITPLTVAQNLIRIDVPLMIAASLTAFAFAADGQVSRLEGAALATAIVAYTLFAIRSGRRESQAVAGEYGSAYGEEGRAALRRLPLHLALAAAGIGLLVVGAGWLVEGAVAVARALGVGELIIGLTVIAVGTSLPELAASIVAAVRGQRDIAVGNVVGSNLFNLLSVLGFTAIAAPAGVQVPSEALAFDLPVMTAVAVACLPIFFNGYRIARWEGALFVGYYAAYVAYLVLTATDSPARPGFGAAVGYFAAPITAVTIGVIAYRQWRAGRSASIPRA